MEYIKVTDNLKFSKVISGMMRAHSEGISGNKMVELVDKCLNLGITTFDHADIPTEQSDYVHYYDPSVKHMMESVNNSLKNLCTDYVDVLLIHR